MPTLASVKRRLECLINPPPPAPPPPPPFEPGHPGNPLTRNYRDRLHLASALAALGEREAPEALDVIVEITGRRPGLAPTGDLATLTEGLDRAATALPDNLSVRLWRAEALMGRGEGERGEALAVSVIRQARPRDLLRSEGADLAAFGTPEMEGTFFHSVDTGDAFLPGDPKTALITAREMLRIHWPDLQGKSVLDIGAYAGWFSFEAERRGAERVTSNDYYSWMVNYPLVWAWQVEQQAQGLAPESYLAPFPINDPAGQPGRVLFDHTRAVLGSKVEPVFGPVETTPLEPHDIVLLLGVLYHHENPIALLRRAFELTRETLIVETLGMEYCASLASSVWHFYGPGDGRGDNTTLWAPSAIALRDALLKVGFRRVELLYGWDTNGYDQGWERMECRLWAHAYR